MLTIVQILNLTPGLVFMWSGFYLAWGGSSCGQGSAWGGSTCGQGSTWSGVVLHVVRVLPGLGFYLAEGSSGRPGFYVTWVCPLIVHHNIFVSGHSIFKDCEVAALPTPDMIVGWQAPWIVSSGLLCWDASVSWAEL